MLIHNSLKAVRVRGERMNFAYMFIAFACGVLVRDWIERM